jgi:histidine triad (HIT) family protein
MSTIFAKIIRGEIAAKTVYEDDLCLAFRDVSPQAPSHILLIPKKEIPSLDEAEASDTGLLGHLLAKVPEIARSEGLARGYRVVINTKEDGGQSVPHLHLHILGGRALQWPPG